MTPRVEVSESAGKDLHAFFDAEWERSMREHPQWASELGDLRFNDRWDDVGLAAVARSEAEDHEALAKLARIPRTKLGKEDQLGYDLFQRDTRLAIEGEAYRQHLLPINQRGGIQTADELADSLSFKTARDFADWNARLRSFAVHVDQTLELLAAAIETGMVQPRVVMERVTAQIEHQIVADPRASPFYAPYRSHPGRPEAKDAEDAIRTSVVPAFVKLKSFWTTRYLPACFAEVGAWQWPHGKEAYAYLVKLHTTTNLTPDEVHAIGLREVVRIRGELEKAKLRAGFEGSTKELFEYLRTNPAFFFKSGDELLAAYKALGDRINPLLPRLFGHLPKTTYTVEAVPDNAAPDTSTAYYRQPSDDGSRPGTFFVNLYEPEARPKWEMMALTMHESVPGHHLQISIGYEQTGIPKFRRVGSYDAFVEGWALYAESLGDELGLYDDPWSKIGQLSYEMWRAVRLVVDTGIHHLKWDRQRAIDFFMENCPKAELDVVNEVDRYIAWPGQALAYKIGELKIKELRKNSHLDVKAFHDALLREGTLPLDVLEAHMKDVEATAPARNVAPTR